MGVALSHFPDELHMKSAFGKRGIITTQEFRFWSHRYGIWITVPVGTYSNFGSVPAIIPPFIAPRVGKIKEAYVIHDWIYQNLGKMTHGRKLTRHQADMILYDAMGVLKVNGLRKGIILSGVRANLYAGYRWNKK